MSDRAVRILQATDAGELLPRIARERDFHECRLCPWANRCWELAGMSDDNIVHFNPWRDFNDAAPPAATPSAWSRIAIRSRPSSMSSSAIARA